MAFDLQEVNQLSWRFIQNFMLMRRNICISNLKDSFPALEEQELEALYRTPCKGQCLFGGALAKTYTVAKARSDALPLYSASHPNAYAAEGKASKKKRKNKAKQAFPKGKTDKKSGTKKDQNFTVTSNAEGTRQVSDTPPTSSNRGRGRGRGQKKKQT